MTPEQWEQIKDIFQSALDREPDKRPAFLDEACCGNRELQNEVARLMSLHEKAGDFIETPASDLVIDLFQEDVTETLVGTHIGAYKVVREIGQGGMGAVYLGVRDDDQYHKRVALKLVKRGMDSANILRRFRNERQILAGLDHANIAKLLDGGTTDAGLPYFVMDYIEGVPIDEYCDTRKLSTVERLRLFRIVCSAVHYAHQNLVVHRDLKPSNILIAADGTPKLLDFGIAKLMNPELAAANIEQTLTVLGPMTPAYASPEQVRGSTITTASDTYSLGVVLYELLTGHPPYRFKSRDPQEIAHVICEEEPQRPSTAVRQTETIPGAGNKTQTMVTPEMVSRTREGQPEKLRRSLSGDLDNIVLMAMRKEPQRRYASVEQFSDDIRRHLEGLPVIARKDTFGYRSAKFIKRNKAGVVAAAVVLVSLVTGLGLALWQARVAVVEKARAERRFNDVRKLAHSLLFELNEQIEKEPTEARSLLVNMALQYLDRLAQEAGGDSSLQRELAEAYDKVGDIMGNPYNSNLGDSAVAIDSYRKALAIRTALVGADPANPEARRDLARSYSQMGSILWTANNTTEVIENEDKALAIYEDLVKTEPSVPNRRGLALSCGMLAEAQAWTGDTTSALENIRKSVTALEAIAAAGPGDTQAQRDLSTAYDKQGEILDAAGDTSRALEAYKKALAICEQQAKSEATDVARRNLAFGYNRVGDLLYEIGDQTKVSEDYEKALEYYRKALAICTEVAQRDQKNVRAQRDVSVSDNKVGDVLWAIGDKRAALESYQKALAIRLALSEGKKANASTENDLAVCYGRIGEALADLGEVERALESHHKAVAIYRSLSDADPANAVTRRDAGDSLSSLAKAYAIAAAQTRLPSVKRIEYWLEAKSSYQFALDVFVELRARGTIRSSDAGQPERISAEIAKCDAELRKLRGPPTSGSAR